MESAQENDTDRFYGDARSDGALIYTFMVNVQHAYGEKKITSHVVRIAHSRKGEWFGEGHTISKVVMKPTKNVTKVYVTPRVAIDPFVIVFDYTRYGELEYAEWYSTEDRTRIHSIDQIGTEEIPVN